MKLKLYAFSIVFIFCSIAFAGDTVDLPANSRIFFNEEDCFEVVELHNNWNIDFALRLRDMEKRGKFIKYPQKTPVNIIETKSYKGHKYYRISISDGSNEQNKMVWTDAVKFD